MQPGWDVWRPSSPSNGAAQERRLLTRPRARAIEVASSSILAGFAASEEDGEQHFLLDSLPLFYRALQRLAVNLGDGSTTDHDRHGKQ